MRGIYALSLALALSLVFALALRTWYSESLFSSRAVAEYIYAQRSAFLRHDLEYTLRQALYYANVCYARSAFTDPSCYTQYLAAWARDWAEEGVLVSVPDVLPFLDGNALIATLSKPIIYSGEVNGQIPAGLEVVLRTGG